MIVYFADPTWWTESHATWTDAIALILIFSLEVVLAVFQLTLCVRELMCFAMSGRPCVSVL